MSDLFFDKMIADLKEGAARSEGFMRGGRVGVEVSRGNHGTESKLASASRLEQHYASGAQAAASHFKVAFLGSMLGQVAGPALARAGLGRVAGGALGRGAASMAGKVMPHIGGGMAGAVFDNAAGMAGGAVGGRLERHPQQGPVG